MSERPISLMLQEAEQAPELVARQLDLNRPLLAELANRVDRFKPRLILTSARGSSNNAATYGKCLIENRLGLPVLTSAPSIGALYRAPVDLRRAIMLSISQSGASFDLVENAKWAKSRGAFVISLLNTVDSALGAVSDVVVPLAAGHEHGIAATKSHIATLSALLQLTAHLGRDPELLGLSSAVPEQLHRARRLDWSSCVETLSDCSNLFTVARGMSLGVAQEAALKFKETCGVHAEAFSGAELMHGPVALIREQYPVLIFGQRDETGPGAVTLARLLRAKGAVVFTAGVALGGATPAERGHALPVVRSVHPIAAPLMLVQTFYALLDAVARRRGVDPDNPPHLVKVTQTL